MMVKKMKETSKILICIFIFLMYFIGIFISFELTFWNTFNLHQLIYLNQVLFVTLLACMGYLTYLTNNYNKLEKKKLQNIKLEKDNIFLLNIFLCIVNTVIFIVVFVLPGIIISINNYQLISRTVILILFIIGFIINLGYILERLKMVLNAKSVVGLEI